MKIPQMLKSGKPVISFEFFPPKTDEGMNNLMETISTLKPLSPSYVSMTYGAGGSTRGKTVELVSKIKHEIGIEAAAHLTCVGHSQAELKSVLTELAQNGIENIVALRGDPPKGQSTFVAAKDGFAHASQLVGFIRKNFKFAVAVAGYPEKHIESPSIEEDTLHLKEKVQAGADVVITQLFFNNADFESFNKRMNSNGINAPVIAGIMPITDYEQIKRFASMCGAKLPQQLSAALEAAGGDKEKVIAIGIEHAVRQCEDLIKKGVAGIHFYTLNKSKATFAIFDNLKKQGLV